MRDEDAAPVPRYNIALVNGEQCLIWHDTIDGPYLHAISVSNLGNIQGVKNHRITGGEQETVLVSAFAPGVLAWQVPQVVE
jgi:hypothetical protein